MPKQQSVVGFKRVAGPASGATLLVASQVIDTGDGDEDFVCAGCARLLLHAKAGQLQRLVVQCAACQTYNALDN